MIFLLYILCIAIGLAFSYIGIVFAMLGGGEFIYIVCILLVATYSIVIFFVINRVRANKNHLSALALITPMFLVFIMVQAYRFGGGLFLLALPDSPSFSKGCETTGPQYIKSPTSPVHSIAYDWNKYAPNINKFHVKFSSYLTTAEYENSDYPKSIHFTERKRSNHEGNPSQGKDEPYIRLPSVGNYYGIPKLTADVLVYYKITPEEELEKAQIDQEMVKYEVVVTDQRNGELLASLNYVIDIKNGRACGLTGKNEMSVRAFVLRTIGL